MPATGTIEGATADKSRWQRGPGRLGASCRPHATADDVPVANPDRAVNALTHGHSRTTRYSGSPADRQADPLRKTAFQAITPPRGWSPRRERARLQARHPVRGRAAGWGHDGFLPSLRV